MVELGVYGFALTLTGVLFTVVGFFAYSRRNEFDEMTGMMMGMSFGMLAAFVVGTLVAIPTADFLTGSIAGVVVGLVVGIPFGRFGGRLGRMEGVMAALMAGFMGSMTGIMILPYNLSLFMQFFFVLLVYVMGELAYMTYKSTENKPSRALLAMAGVIALIVLAPIFLLNFNITPNLLASQTNTFSGTTASVTAGSLALQASPNPANVQQATIHVSSVAYSPNTIPLKKGITFIADPNAGCGRALTVPSLGIQKIIPQNGEVTIEFTPQQEGAIPFRCSMGMVRGQFTVTS